MTEKPLHEVLAELRALEAKATPAPWVPGPDTNIGTSDNPRSVVCGGYSPADEPMEEKDRALIVALRNALPRLLEAFDVLAFARADQPQMQAEVDRDYRGRFLKIRSQNGLSDDLVLSVLLRWASRLLAPEPVDPKPFVWGEGPGMKALEDVLAFNKLRENPATAHLFVSRKEEERLEALARKCAGARIANVDKGPGPATTVDDVLRLGALIGQYNERSTAQRAVVNRLLVEIQWPLPETILVSRADYDTLLAGNVLPAGRELQLLGVPIRVEP